MSKSSELSKTVKAYILENIDGSGYGVELKTVQEKVNFLYETFMSEYGWMIQRVGQTEALRQWFMGLPSACTVAFMNGDILKLAHDWDSLPVNPTEAQEQKIINNWFNLVANKTSQMFRTYGVQK